MELEDLLPLLPRRVNPRRCARAGQYFSPTNIPYLSIYNDSTGPSLLSIIDVRVVAQSATAAFLSYTTNGKVGSFVTQGTPIFTGIGALPGAFYTLDSASGPVTEDYQWQGIQQGPAWWPHEFPIAILSPGFSFVVSTGDTGGHALYASFVWEVIPPEEML